MTTTEATTLAAHVEQPDIAPVCKCGATKVLAAHSSRYVSRYWVCRACKARKQREVYQATHIANQQAQPESPPACKVCGSAKSGYRHSAYRCACWTCKRCKNRKQREKYNANTAAGLSDTGVPLEAVSQTVQGRAAAQAVRERREATPCGQSILEHLGRERRLGIGGKGAKR